MSAAVYRMWLVCGYLGEGLDWLRQFAAPTRHTELAPPRLNALFTAGTLAMFQGDYTGARTLVDESLLLARATRNSFQVARGRSAGWFQLKAAPAGTIFRRTALGIPVSPELRCGSTRTASYLLCC